MKCYFCPLEFETEEDLNTHSLFVHFKLNPVCTNTKLVDKEIRQIEKIRKQYKEILRKKTYYEQKYPREVLYWESNNRYRSDEDPPKVYFRYWKIVRKWEAILEKAKEKRILLE